MGAKVARPPFVYPSIVRNVEDAVSDRYLLDAVFWAQKVGTAVNWGGGTSSHGLAMVDPAPYQIVQGQILCWPDTAPLSDAPH